MVQSRRAAARAPGWQWTSREGTNARIPFFARLMVIVALLAAAVAALRWPSGWAASTVSIVTMATLLVATLGALYTRGQHRASRLGIALFGWFYLAMAIPEWSSFWQIRYELTYPLEQIWTAVNPHPPYVQRSVEARGHFIWTGHFLAALAAAGIGRMIGCLMDSQSRMQISQRRQA